MRRAWLKIQTFAVWKIVAILVLCGTILCPVHGQSQIWRHGPILPNNFAVVFDFGTDFADAIGPGICDRAIGRPRINEPSKFSVSDPLCDLLWDATPRCCNSRSRSHNAGPLFGPIWNFEHGGAVAGWYNLVSHIEVKAHGGAAARVRPNLLYHYALRVDLPVYGRIQRDGPIEAGMSDPSSLNSKGVSCCIGRDSRLFGSLNASVGRSFGFPKSQVQEAQRYSPDDNLNDGQNQHPFGGDRHRLLGYKIGLFSSILALFGVACGVGSGLFLYHAVDNRRQRRTRLRDGLCCGLCLLLSGLSWWAWLILS